jgi:outer membrane lipoprotein SlyB
MRKTLVLAVSLLAFFLTESALAGPLNCTNPELESVRLLCKANEIKARRVQTVVGGALAGALIGNLLAKQNGGNTDQATIAGALAGGLSGYWLSVQNEIAAKSASATARAAEVKARAAAEVKRQKASAVNLRAELKTVMLRSSDDPKKREAALAQIAQAANLGIRQAQDSAKGYTQVGAGLGANVNGNSMFASTATDFNRTRVEACSQLSRPGSYCS